MSERDSHFAGFAELLLGEIKKKYAWVEPFQCEGSEMDDLYRLIAQRAYDLVFKHALVYLREGADIPDMTEWPE